MSKDFTFAEIMNLDKISNLYPFGIFCAKMDKKEMCVGKGDVITDPKEKMDLFKQTLIEYINKDSYNFRGATCIQVADFALDYVEEMDLFKEPGWEELKNTLMEIKTNEKTLEVREAFKFILDYCEQLNLFKNEPDIAR